jgi:hypothetical protein
MHGVFTRVRHLSLFLSVWIQPMPSHTIYFGSILILYFHLHLVLKMASFSGGLPPNRCIHLSFAHACHLPRPSHSPRFYEQINIWWVEIMKLAAVNFSPTTCYFLRLRYECLPEYPTPENPQFLSLIWPSFALIPNNKQGVILFILIFMV